MKKATVISSLLATAALAAVACTLFRQSADYDFLNGAERISTAKSVYWTKGEGKVQMFNLHQPYETVWSEAQAELCEKHGFKLSGPSNAAQIFDHDGREMVTISRGKVNQDLDFLEGTDLTDTYVIVRTLK